jgi:hypothetical protein
MTSVVIYNGVKTIGNGAFRGCTSLSTIAIPNSVTLIGQSAFRNCASLSVVIFPSNDITIQMFAFKDCINLKEVTISYYSIIDNLAFDNTTKIIIDKTKLINTIEYCKSHNQNRNKKGLVLCSNVQYNKLNTGGNNVAISKSMLYSQYVRTKKYATGYL